MRMQEEKICRICFESEETYTNKLIYPCKCKGHSKYIHEACLNEWRRYNANNPEKRDKCEICKYNFVIRTNNESNYSTQNEDTSLIYYNCNDFFRKVFNFMMCRRNIDYQS